MRKVGPVLLVSMALTLSPGLVNVDNSKINNSWLANNSFLTQKTAAASTVTTKIKYTVKAGDSLWTIARRNSTTVEKIMKTNKLSSDRLQIGQILYLEIKTQKQTATQTKSTNQANQANQANQVEVNNTEEKNQAVELDETKTPSRGVVSDLIGELLSTAKHYTGVRYVYGGSGPKGFDCSGFTQYVFAKHGIKLPRCSYEQAKIGAEVSRSQARPGDLVFFNTQGGRRVSHVGIYVGGGNFIHANIKKGVTISTLDTGYYRERLVTIRRAIR